MQTLSPRSKPRPRLRDIADRAQLSVTTVSMALRDSDEIAAGTRSRVRKLAERMGYTVPAHGRRERRSPRVPQQRFGLCFIGGASSGPSTNALIRGASSAATQTNSRVEVLMIGDLSDGARVAAQAVEFGAKLGGVLLWGYVDRALCERLAGAGVNYVVLGNNPFLPGEMSESLVRVVSNDAAGMGWAATTSLLRRGHRRVGFVCEQLPPRMYNASWLAGYRQAHFDAGVDLDGALCVVCGERGSAGERGPREIFALSERPTAYVLSDATAAKLFLEGMKRHGAAPPPDALVIGAEFESVEQYGFGDYGLIISNLDRVAEVGLAALERAAAGVPLFNGRLEVPFVTRNFTLSPAEESGHDSR